MRLRTKIIFVSVLFALFVAAAVLYYLQYPARESFRRELENNMRVLGEANGRTYSAIIEGLKIRAVDWSTSNVARESADKILDSKISPALQKKAADDFANYFLENKMPDDSRVVMVELLDREGIVVASTRQGRIGVDERKEEVGRDAHYFSKTIRAGVGETFVRSLIMEVNESSSPMSHVTVRMFSRKKDANGKPIPLDGVFLLHITSPGLFGDAPENTFLTGFFDVASSSDNLGGGLPLGVHLVSTLQAKGSAVTKPVQECVERGRGIVDEYLNESGVLVVGVSRCFEDEGVVLLSEIEKKKAYGLLQNIATQILFGGGALLIVLIIYIVLASRRLLRNISFIVEAASAVAKGNFTRRIPTSVTGRDEISYLTQVFNVMLDAVSTSREKLEKSEKNLLRNAEELSRELAGHEEQVKFVEQSKRATQNLLEDAWDIKEKLEAERKRLETILSSIGDALVLIDGKYMIMQVNPKALELFALSPEEMIGKDLRVVMKIWKKKKGELPPGEWPIEEMFLTKRVVVADLEDELSLTTLKRTAELPIALSAAPLVGQSGEMGGVIVIRDVREDRELDEAKSGFISVASHQLRTPLTTIRWYSEMLLADDAGSLSKDQRDFLSEIHGGAERLYQTIDLLLGISRVESGKLKAEQKPIDLSLFTADLGKELLPQMDEKKLTFSVVTQGETPVIVYLDPLTLRQVVLNLVSNAIRYTNDHGTIEARWTVNDEHTEVTYAVKDNGIGIPLAQRGRIFSKFFRAENALSKVPDGSGLGLALVKELVLAWGGKVWFEVEEGKGTTFFFTIPLAREVPVLAKENADGIMGK